MPNTALLIKNPLAATHEFKQACQLCYPKTGTVRPPLAPLPGCWGPPAWTPRRTGPRVPIREQGGHRSSRETVEVGALTSAGEARGREGCILAPATRRRGPGWGVQSAASPTPPPPTQERSFAFRALLRASHGDCTPAQHPGGKGFGRGHWLGGPGASVDPSSKGDGGGCFSAHPVSHMRVSRLDLG